MIILRPPAPPAGPVLWSHRGESSIAQRADFFIAFYGNFRAKLYFCNNM